MRSVIIVGVCASALALSACQHVTPEQQVNMINAFANAGCKGTITASAGGATGQLGGGFHADVGVSGSCDPANAPKMPSEVGADALTGNTPIIPLSKLPPT
jgi:hypothetical protein